jgi:hypothetical protein
MKLRILACCVATLFSVTLSATRLAAQDWGDKMFDGLQIKFGNVARLADTTFNIRVKNPYAEEIRITSLTTSCGCISWTDQLPISIPSLADRQLTIRLDTVRHVGDKHVKAFVTLSEPIKGLTANVTLFVEGRIRNDFEVRPSSVAFGSIDQGRESAQRVGITYSGQRDWKIISAKTSSEFLTTRIVEKSRASGSVQYDVIVEITPHAPAGVLRDHLILTTNEIGNSDVSIPIEGKIESEFVVTDAHFGMVTQGNSKSVTVILRGKKPFQIEKIEQVARVVTATPTPDGTNTAIVADRSETPLTDAGHAFKTEFSTTIAPMHMVTLTMTPSTETGIFNERFSVAIGGRTQPVIFQANGRVLDSDVISAAR